MSGALIAAANSAAIGRVVLNSAALNTSTTINIGIQLNRNGSARTIRTGSGDIVWNWFILPITNIGDFYEVGVLVSVGAFSSGPASGTWVPLDGTLSRWERGSPGAISGSLRVRIASTDTEVASVAFLLAVD